MNGVYALKIIKYFEVAKINYFNSLAYVINALSRSGVVVIRIWIFAQLYKITYAASGAEEIGGLTVAMVVWSLMMTQSFQSSGLPRVSDIIDEEVKTGALAYSINRPYSYILFHLSGYLGRSASNLFINLLIGSAAAFILVGPVKITLFGILFGAVLMIFGRLLDFLISFIIGLAAFWIEDTTAIAWIYSKGQMVFGGIILPIALFPDYLQKIAEFLPFSQLFYSAARLIVNFDVELFQKFILIQFFWIAFFAALAYFIFKKGLKYVTINGG